ncbi:MAG: MFS transporter [Phycisphaera sp. TMED9]|nr:MAG: MFS transporter [Phycisphaera sp. TMED9]
MSDPIPVESGTEQADPRTRVWNRNFTGLVITQFAGATNDNILKTVLLLQFARGQKWFDTLGDGGTGIISLMLTVPFVLLLGFAGQLADRLPKHRIITATRLVEVPIAGLAMYGFFIDSPWTVLVAYVLLASESAFFSPSKYGSIREITGDARLNEANGIINLSTNIAILFGIGIGGPLLHHSEDAVGVVLVVFALIGLGSSLMIRGLVAQGVGLKRRMNPFASYFDTIRSIRPGLIWAASLAWAWFYAAAIVVIAVVPEYTTPLGLSGSEGSLLLGSIGLGIGIGCLLAGRLSGARIRGGFTVWGGAVFCGVFFLLGATPLTVLNVWVLSVALLLAGTGAGFFLIPLQAIQQMCSSPGERARVLATANALSFLLMSLASAAYWALVAKAGVSPFHVLLLVGVLMLGITLWIRHGTGRQILLATAPSGRGVS